MPERILVTGGAGFIGSHLVERLLSEGHAVHVVDDLSTGRLANLDAVRDHPGCHLVIDTILNYTMLRDVASQVDRVIHLAAAVGVMRLMNAPVETITTNVRGTEIVLDLCHASNLPLFVASTSEVYGKAGERLGEDDDRVMGSVRRRRWAYACTKSLDEFLALAYHEEHHLPVVVGRFFNTVGPRQSAEWGMVFPTFVRQALRGDPITVYGSGEQLRCFCHVRDVVGAICRLIWTPEAVGQVFNVGREEEISIRDLAKRIRDRLGSDSEIVEVGYEEAYGKGFEDMMRRQPDTTRLRALTGWEPTLSLDEMIDHVADSFLDGD